MKKYLLLASVAALAFTSCSDQSTEFVGEPQAREISFTPIAKPQTRSALHASGTNLPAQNLYVAAYQASATTGNYFAKTSFVKDGSNYSWAGSPKRYWPLSAATINFLAVTGNNYEATPVDIGEAVSFAAENDNYASKATVAYTGSSYSSATQADIMYAVGQGTVSYVNNTISFDGGSSTDVVDMTFNHALALLNFQVKANAAAAGVLTVNSITINGANYTGTLNIKYDNYASTTRADAITQPTIKWTPSGGEADATVVGISNYAITNSNYNTYYPVNTGENPAWANIMILPSDTYYESPATAVATRGFNSFTITYTVNESDSNSHTYTYTYWPSGTENTAYNVEQGKIYNFQITLNLHEITINPSVTDWTVPTSAPTPIVVP